MAALQFLTAHAAWTKGHLRVFEIQTAFGLQTVVQWRPGDRTQDGYHGLHQSGFLNESELFVENKRIVAVEADNEACLDYQTCIAYSANFGSKTIAAGVLVLADLCQGLISRRLDADEHGEQVG